MEILRTKMKVAMEKLSRSRVRKHHEETSRDPGAMADRSKKEEGRGPSSPKLKKSSHIPLKSKFRAVRVKLENLHDLALPHGENKPHLTAEKSMRVQESREVGSRPNNPELPSVQQHTAQLGEISCPTTSSHVIIVNEGAQGPSTLAMDSGMLAQMKQAVLSNRDFRQREQEMNAELEDLDRQCDRISRQITLLEARIAKYKGEDSGPGQNSLAKLNGQLARKKMEYVSVEGERDRFEGRVHSLQYDQNSEQRQLFCALEAVLLESKVLPPPRPVAPQANREPVPRASRRSPEYDAGIPQELSQMYCAYNREALSHSLIGTHSQVQSPNGRARRWSSSKSSSIRTTEEEAAQEAYVDSNAALKSNFETAKAQLHSVEVEFDRREYTDEEEAMERYRKQMAGEDVEPQLEFDLKQLQRHQQETRALIEAEEAYAKAKAEAFDAGVYIEDGDIESVFADHDLDGYKLSCEQELVASVDKARINSWLHNIPDAETLLIDPGVSEGSAGPTQCSDSAVELGDWEAASIDLCDSWSMTADGPERRRIDLWNKACILLTPE